MNSTIATARAHASPGTKPSCSKYRAAPSSPGPPKAPNNFWAPWAIKITPTKERSMKFAQFLYELSHLSSISFHLLSSAFSHFDTNGNLPNAFSRSVGFRQDHAKHAAFESGFDMIDVDAGRNRNRSLEYTERSC